ncbi:hypothetical protein MXD81_41800 [Microbacteriaceae bacterium K1510]|nr:hypothetical protein [Microbacteriaceae bacterium K1510]
MNRSYFSCLTAHAASRLAVILGTNEIASAVAVHLQREGWRVILSYDSFPPVIRRAMAFHDVLFGDCVRVDGVQGERAETTHEIVRALAPPSSVAVTPLHLTDLLAVFSLDALVDARMHKHHATPDLRGNARITVGLGPNFEVGTNCDIAVETRPLRNGKIVKIGATDAADGIASQLGDFGAERFVYSDTAGLWHAPVDIGTRVFKNFVVGHLDGRPIHAPLDGIIRGIVRDGLSVPAGVKLLEIDPRGRQASWTGIDARGRDIAEATVKAIRLKADSLAARAAAAMSYL